MEIATYGDILFIAIVAGFIIYKLYSVFGQKSGNEDLRKIQKELGEDSRRVVHILNDKKTKSEAITSDFVDEEEPEIKDSGLINKLSQIKKSDKNFSAGKFLAGAKVAFEMIIKSFSAGDKKTLNQLLSKELNKEFVGEIDKEIKAGRKESTTLVAILSSEISDVSIVNGKMARIEVKFISEQINVTKDNTGKIIEGDPSEINKVEDKWIFEKDLRSPNPNWIIIST